MNKEFIKIYKDNIKSLDELKSSLIQYKLQLKGEYTQQDLEIMECMNEQIMEFIRVLVTLSEQE